MTNLSSNLTSHVIITHSGGHYFITNQQNEKLRFIGANDYFEVSDNKIKGSSIAEVMTREKYYETYPQKEVLNYNAISRSNFVYPDFRSEQLSHNGLLAMIKGIKRAIAEFRAEGKEPIKAIELLEKAEKSYKEKYQAKL